MLTIVLPTTFYLSFSFVTLSTEINQPIRPAELPIIGDPYTDIDLDLLFATRNATFALIGKKIQLTQPLDRDAENLSHIVFQVNKKKLDEVLLTVFVVRIILKPCFFFYFLGILRGQGYEQKKNHTHYRSHNGH